MWDTPDNHGLIFSLFKYHCVVHFLTFDRMSFGNSFVVRHFNSERKNSNCVRLIIAMVGLSIFKCH